MRRVKNGILTAATGLLAVLSLSACGGGGGLATPDAATAQYPEKPTLSVAGGTLIGDESAVRFSMAEDGQGITATLELAEGAQLATLYTDIAYDPTQLSLETIETVDELGGRQLLALGVNSEPGLVQTGHVLPNFDVAEPLIGGGTLATLHFRHGPQPQVRRTAQVPRTPQAAAPMSAFAGPMFSGGDALISAVQYTNPGDYDQNGVVTIADLTPLGLHFLKTGPFANDVSFIGIESYPVETVVDGDGNGEINLADLTVIGQNFGNDVLGGYNIYASSTMDAIPADAEAVSTIPPVTAAALSGGAGDPSSERLRFGYIQPSAPADEVWLWARPLDSEGNEGTVSEVAYLAGAPSPVLDLDTAPISGSGTESDPYFVDPNVDYDLMLNHGIDGDVTINEDSFYFLIGGFSTTTGPGGGGEIIRIREISSASREPSAGLIGSGFEVPNVGEIDQEQAILDIVDIFQGGFTILATYKGRISNTLHLYAPDLDNLPPVAVLDADSTTGVAPWTVSLSATNSSDSDGDVVQWDWDLDGDNIYEIEDGTGTQEIDITSGGTRTVRLRVTDDDLATAVATRVLTTEGWLSMPLDSVSDNLPADPMLSVIDGHPAVAYRRFNTLKYMRAANPQGTAWNAPQAVPLTVTAQHISLRELDSGRPAMAYQRSGVDAGIYYVVGNAPDATSFQQVRITSDSMDHSPSLNIIDGNPALAYIWHTGDVDDPYSVYYVRATDPVASTGGDWDLFNGGVAWEGNEFYMDKTGLTTVDADLPGTDGRPAIFVISNNDKFDLPWSAYFIRSLNNSGTSWTLIPFSLEDNDSDPLSYAVATSIVSRPHVAVLNPTGLLVRKSENFGGTNWTSPQYVGDPESSDFGYHMSIANVGGFLGLGYYSTEEQAVTYRATETPDLDDGFPVGGVVATGVGEYDTTEREAKYISVGSAMGEPVLAYHDLVNAELRFAYYYVP